MVKGIRISDEGRRPRIEQRCALRWLNLLVHDGFPIYGSEQLSLRAAERLCFFAPHSDPTHQFPPRIPFRGYPPKPLNLEFFFGGRERLRSITSSLSGSVAHRPHQETIKEKHG